MGVGVVRYLGFVPRDVKNIIDNWIKQFQYNVDNVFGRDLKNAIYIDVYVNWGCSSTALKDLVNKMGELGYEWIWINASDGKIDILFVKHTK